MRGLLFSARQTVVELTLRWRARSWMVVVVSGFPIACVAAYCGARRGSKHNRMPRHTFALKTKGRGGRAAWILDRPPPKPYIPPGFRGLHPHLSVNLATRARGTTRCLLKHPPESVCW